VKHLLFELEGCPFDLLDDHVLIEGTLIGASYAAQATLLHSYVHKFEPQGVTGFALLAESHISIHTWPEDGRAVCDVFTCGDHTLPVEAMTYIENDLKPKSTKTTFMSRH
jgi:S-adenosylmethionine decarboxylase